MKLLKLPVSTQTKLVETIKSIPGINLDTGPWVAGGAARRVFLGDEISGSDIDIFAASAFQMDMARKTFEMPHPSRSVVRTAANKRTGTVNLQVVFAAQCAVEEAPDYMARQTIPFEHEIKVQIIAKYFPTVEDMFADFDFTVCEFATDGRTIVTTEEAVRDLKDGVLNVRRDSPALGTPYRLIKYATDYGFTPAPGVMDWVCNLNRRTKIDQHMHVEPGSGYY